MEKKRLESMYEAYIGSAENRDSEKAKEIFSTLFDDTLSKILTIDLQNCIYHLVIEYATEIEKKSYIDGFRNATQLWKECGL